jgi:hypothetical protein
MKMTKNDQRVAAIVTLVAGGILTASGVMAFVESARQNHGVSRFLLGYTLLWSGMTIIGQIKHSKILSKIMKLTSSSNANQRETE